MISSYPWTPGRTTVDIYLKDAYLHVPQIGIALDHIIQGTCTPASNGMLEKQIGAFAMGSSVKFRGFPPCGDRYGSSCILLLVRENYSMYSMQKIDYLIQT